jgi:putative ABC transport system permease protein
MVLAIPLAWLQLKQDKLRLAIALLGVGFAVVLIFMQLGFQDALFSSSVRFHTAFEYDIAVISPRTSFIGQPRSFSRRRMYQALSHPDVASVSSNYMSLGLWKNPRNPAESRVIYIVGINPEENSLKLPGVENSLEQIRLPDVALYDRLSRPEFGPIPELLESGQNDGRGLFTEVEGRRIGIVGLYELGTSFGIDGSLVTSDLNFLRIFPNRPPGLINLGLISLLPGSDPSKIRTELEAQLPQDVEIMTRDQFVQREIDYWNQSTPIGYIFSFGVIVGLFVGSIIVYQILFADVSDHLQEYATLKAMGYSNGYLFGLVFQEAVLMAVLGFIPGYFITLGLYGVAGDATQLPLEMTASRAIMVLLLTVAMCMISGSIAMRKIRTLDPADIY